MEKFNELIREFYYVKFSVPPNAEEIRIKNEMKSMTHLFTNRSLKRFYIQDMVRFANNTEKIQFLHDIGFKFDPDISIYSRNMKLLEWFQRNSFSIDPVFIFLHIRTFSNNELRWNTRHLLNFIIECFKDKTLELDINMTYAGQDVISFLLLETSIESHDNGPILIDINFVKSMIELGFDINQYKDSIKTIMNSFIQIGNSKAESFKEIIKFLGN